MAARAHAIRLLSFLIALDPHRSNGGLITMPLPITNNSPVYDASSTTTDYLSLDRPVQRDPGSFSSEYLWELASKQRWWRDFQFPARCYLLNTLPQEVQRMIYEIILPDRVFTHQNPYIKDPNPYLVPPQLESMFRARSCLGLFLSCRQLHDDASVFFLRHATFIYVVGDDRSDLSLFKTMPLSQRSLIQNLEIRFVSPFGDDGLFDFIDQIENCQFLNNAWRIIRDMKIRETRRIWSKYHNELLTLLPGLTRIQYDFTRIRCSCYDQFCDLCGNLALRASLEDEDPLILGVPGIWLLKSWKTDRGEMIRARKQGGEYETHFEVENARYAKLRLKLEDLGLDGHFWDIEREDVRGKFVRKMVEDYRRKKDGHRSGERAKRRSSSA